MKEVKEPKSFYKQLSKLKERGCIIGDENYVLQTLMRVNYYRLTAYFLPYKTQADTYKDGTTFNKVHRTYEFDRKLSHLLFSIIEEIELTLRTQIAYFHSRKYGALGYMDENNFSKHHNHTLFLEHIQKSIDNNSTQAFVEHHITHYDGKFPLWVMVELMTCGEISLFYSDLKISDKKEFALKRYGTTHYNLSQWLHCMTDLRNFCAHYARLYYNLFPAIPPTPSGFSYTLYKRIFDYILVLKFLYHSPERLSSVLLTPLQSLIEEYSDSIELSHIGFPENWTEIIKEPTPKRKMPIKKTN